MIYDTPHKIFVTRTFNFILGVWGWGVHILWPTQVYIYSSINCILVYIYYIFIISFVYYICLDISYRYYILLDISYRYIINIQYMVDEFKHRLFIYSTQFILIVPCQIPPLLRRILLPLQQWHPGIVGTRTPNRSCYFRLR